MNGWFDNLFGGDTPSSVGQKVLKAYFEEASKFPEFGFWNFEAWISSLNSKVENFPEFIGELVIANKASTSVEMAMDREAELANRTGGTATIAQITQTAGGRGDTINWAVAAPEIASESIQDVTNIAQNVGRGVIGSLNMVKFLPIILLGAGALYIYVSASKGKGIFKP